MNGKILYEKLPNKTLSKHCISFSWCRKIYACCHQLKIFEWPSEIVYPLFFSVYTFCICGQFREGRKTDFLISGTQ